MTWVLPLNTSTVLFNKISTSVVMMRFQPELVVTARKVSEFLNFCLSRYPFDNLLESTSASVPEESGSSPTRKRCRSTSNIEIKPMSLVSAGSGTPEVIVVSQLYTIFTKKF